MIPRALAAPAVTINPGEGVVSLFDNAFRGIIIPFLAAVAVGAVIYSGVLFMTSQGDPQKLSKAKKTLLYSIIGIILVVLSYAIVIALSKVIQSQL